MSKKPTYEQLEKKVKDLEDKVFEFKRTEEALRKSEDLARATLNATTDRVYLTDPNGNLLTVNDLAAKRLGKTPDELIGTNVLDYFPSDVAKSRKKQADRVLGSGKPVCFQDEREGRVSNVSIYPTFDAQGNVDRLAVFVTDITELKRVEEQLRDSEYRFRTLFQNAPIGIGLASLDGRIVAGNDAIIGMFGYSEEELRKVNTKDFYLNPEERSLVFDRFRKKDSTNDYVVKFKRKDGTRFDAKLTIIPFTHYGEDVHLTVIEDVTGRKRMEEALRESRDRYARAEKIGHFGHWDGDFIENKSVWSSELYRIFGVDPDKVKSTYEEFLKLVHPSDRENLKSTVAAALSQGGILELGYRIIRPDGEERFIHSVTEVHLDKKDHPTKSLGIIQDITERKRAERDLKIKDSAIASSINAIGITDLHGKLLYVNDSCVKMWGYDSEHEMLGRALPEFWEGEGVFKTMKALHDKGGAVGEDIGKRKDGSLFDVQLSASMIKDETGNPLYMFGSFLDITERKRMEEEITRTKKLETLGILAGGLAHDFNNLLTPILANISIAKTYGNLDPEIAEMLTDAEKASLRAKDLTQQLLTFAKGGAPIKKTISLSRLLRDTAKFALSGSNVSCEHSIPDDLWPVEVDEGQISQVIHNMVINADQAMAEGGIMRIRVENLILEEKEHVNLKEGDRYVKISIEDQGHGIPQEQLSKIFDPFFTIKEKGRGLGLSTSLSIVTRHEGHIHVDSKMGVGTILHIYLPASEKKPEIEEKVKGKPIKGEGKVLLIDDEESIRKSAREVLKRLGYQVQVAKDHAKGIQLYEKAMEEKHPFDTVIMDLTIPGSMGGLEAMKKLKKIDRNAKVIISSGYSEDRAMSKFREYGFCGVVAKPYKVEDLAKVIHNVLNGVEG